MTFETENDNVDSGATENTAAEVETEQTQDQEQAQEHEQAQDDEHSDGTEKQEPKPEPKKNRAQERIQQLAREKAEMAAKLAEYEAKAQKRQVADQAPQVADFDSYDDYLKAQQEWTIDQAAKRIEEKQSQQQQTQESARREAEFFTAVEELSSEGVDIAAYEQKINMLPQLPVTVDQFGLSAKDQLLLIKQLADDEDTWHEIAGMTPIQAAAKIGQIIAKPKAAAPKVSKAPPPVKPVKANAPTKRNEEDMSDAEWLRARRQK